MTWYFNSFQLSRGGVLALDLMSEVKGLEMVSRLLDAVYVGCDACSKPLTQVCKYDCTFTLLYNVLKLLEAVYNACSKPLI